MKPHKILTALLLSLYCLVQPAALKSQDTVLVYPLKDLSFSTGMIPVGGQAGQLHIGWAFTGPLADSFMVCMKFIIPQGLDSVVGAQLRLMHWNNDNVVIPGIGLKRLNAYWNENTANWNTVKPIIDSSLQATFTLYPPDSYINFPPQLIQSWADDPDNNFGFILQPQHTDGLIRHNIYYDIESSGTLNLSPVLFIAYHSSSGRSELKAPALYFPNPVAAGQAFLLTTDGSCNAILSIYMQDGRLLRNIALSGAQTGTRLSIGLCGMYLLRIVTNDGRTGTYKLIVH